MSHDRSDLRDLELNLVGVPGRGDVLGAGARADLDEEFEASSRALLDSGSWRLEIPSQPGGQDPPPPVRWGPGVIVTPAPTTRGAAR